MTQFESIPRQTGPQELDNCRRERDVELAREKAKSFVYDIGHSEVMKQYVGFTEHKSRVGFSSNSS